MSSYVLQQNTIGTAINEIFPGIHHECGSVSLRSRDTYSIEHSVYLKAGITNRDDKEEGG